MTQGWGGSREIEHKRRDGPLTGEAPPGPSAPWLSHCEHHRLGVHAWNYGDLPAWDLLLGIFRNPMQFKGPCGFESPADRKLGSMLAFRDVDQQLYAAASLGVDVGVTSQ